MLIAEVVVSQEHQPHVVQALPHVTADISIPTKMSGKN
jgi:hypothetical protein